MDFIDPNRTTIGATGPVPAPAGCAQPGLLGELICILKLHPKGLRRWSVMRAMRETRKLQSREVPPKFEQDVERVFRRYCVDESALRVCGREEAPFFRPRETAGEVWAVHPARAKAFAGLFQPEAHLSAR
jgi:hypothetical protein